MRLWRYGRAIEQLGQRYRLEGALGSGGMADVCLAWDERDEREVAIKVIKPDVLDQRSLDRFLKEAAQVANWKHPNILHIYSDLKLELLDAAQGAIVPYIVMEYAQGGDLQKRLTAGQPYPLAETLHIFAQLCSAVAYAHEHGVIHRDLKPLNILFRVLPDNSEQMVLSDFGLAVEMDATHHTFARGGTLPYMAPEQLQGHVEAASDIFALGVILYQLCTGRLPFRRSLQDLRRADAFALPPAPRTLEPTLPPELDDAILTALVEDPTARYSDAHQFWQTVQSCVPALSTSTQNHSIPTSRPINTRILSNPYSTEPSSGPARPRPVTHSSNAQSIRRGTPDTRPATSSHSHTHIPATTNHLSAPTTRRSNPIDTFAIVPPTPGTARTSSNPNIETDPRRATLTRGTSHSTETDIVNLVPNPRPSLPTRPTSPARALPPRPRPIAPRVLIILAPIALFVLIITGTIIYFVPSLSNKLTTASPSITVTITPDRQSVQRSYDIPANTVNAHQVTSSQSQSRPVQSSGHKQIQATQAKGQLTFTNGAFIPQNVAAGTALTGKDGVQVTTDADANIPAASSATGTTSNVTVSAHAVNPGRQGNIPSLELDTPCCIANKSIFVRNASAFTGGQDAQDYNFIQQSDVNTVANPLADTLTKQGQEGLNTRMAPNERIVGTPQCSPNSTTDPKRPVGDTGVNIPATTVTVSVQCSAEAYDKGLLQTQVTALLQSSTSPGPNYGLGGSAISQVNVQGQAVQSNANLLVNVTATWIYQISREQQQRLAQRIAGLTVTAALKQLTSETGIRNAAIPGQPPDRQLPGDPAHISIVIQNTGDL